MNPEEYRNFLLQNLPHAIPASGLSEVVCKCFYCPDNGSHHHMYVSIPKTENEPSWFNCFKCGTSGMVTYKRLIEWQIFDQEMNIILTEHNRSVMNNPLNMKIYGDGIMNVRHSFIRDEELSYRKLAFINSRLGTNLTFEDCVSDKIILNINDFLKQNYIQKLTRSINFVNELNTNFVGFLSYDNNFISLRNMGNSWIDERYIVYNTFEKKDNTKKMYIIPTSVDVRKPIKVHITEGPFDALSVKHNLRRDFDNCIYTAITGNAYKGVLRELIINQKLINLEIHLYPDSDTKEYVIKDLIEFLRVYKFPVYIHRNQIGKDMGESLEKIKETIELVVV